jgi:hypothetical protein
LPPWEERNGSKARAEAADGAEWQLRCAPTDAGKDAEYWFPPEYAHLAPDGAPWERLEALLQWALAERARRNRGIRHKVVSADRLLEAIEGYQAEHPEATYRTIESAIAKQEGASLSAVRAAMRLRRNKRKRGPRN